MSEAICMTCKNDINAESGAMCFCSPNEAYEKGRADMRREMMGGEPDDLEEAARVFSKSGKGRVASDSFKFGALWLLNQLEAYRLGDGGVGRGEYLEEAAQLALVNHGRALCGLKEVEASGDE